MPCFGHCSNTRQRRFCSNLLMTNSSPTTGYYWLPKIATMTRTALFCLAILCFLPKRHALRVTHPKGNSYAYFDEGYGRRISSLSSSSPSPSELSAEEPEKQSSDSHESPSSNSGSSYEKILSDFASSFGGSDSGEGRGVERDHSDMPSLHRPRSADQPNMSAKLFSFNIHSSPKLNQERDKNRYGNIFRDENERETEHRPGAFAQEVIPKLTEMIFNSKPLSMSEDETLVPRGHSSKMSHDQPEYGSVVRYRTEPEPSRYSQEYKSFHESPPSYQTKTLSGTYSNQHHPREHEPYKSTSSYDSYLPSTYSNYRSSFAHETKDEEEPHHEPPHRNQHHLPYMSHKMSTPPPPPTESYMTLSFEPSSSKGSKSNYKESRYESPHYSSHQHSNPVESPPSYHHHSQYSSELPKMYHQEESPQRIYKISNYVEKSSLPSHEGPNYGKNSQGAEVMSYYRTFSTSPSTNEQQTGYGQRSEPTSHQSYSSPIGHFYASEPVGKPKVASQPLDSENKYDWKQSVQRYAKEFGFEVPSVASRVGEPSPVHEEEVQMINGPAPVAAPTSPDEKRFFHNPIQPQFEQSERIYAQHQPPSATYDPSPSDSQLKAKFDLSKPEQDNDSEKADKEMSALLKKYSDIVNNDKEADKQKEKTKNK